MNKLATIEKVKNVRQHPNADRLKLANVNEYQVVTAAADLEDGDLVVYFSIDSILPELPIFDFMKPHKYRVKMAKLRGEVSNGLIIPLSEFIQTHKEFTDILKNEPDEKIEGYDVSEILNVEKFSKPIPASLAGEVVGDFLTQYCSKTDEDRFENFPELFDLFKGKEVYVGVKIDGSSGTAINDGDLHICSRNLELKNTEKNTLWKLARKYDLANRLPRGCALQFEIYGEGIQKNPLGIKGQDISVFNVVDIQTRKLLPLDQSLEMCQDNGIPFVPIYYRGIFKWETLQELKKEVNEVKYANGKYAEGLVFRLTEPEYCDKIGKELSLKIISENYKD